MEPSKTGARQVTLQSGRLRLYPVSNAEMEALILAEADPEMKQAYGEMLEGCLKDPQTRVWNAVWLMELKDQPGVIAGDFSFKGLGADGMVEIGYGLRDGFCGHGYMTEAVRTASAWALSQPGVRRVEAETTDDNAASLRVLLRAGYRPLNVRGKEGLRYLYCGDARNP